MRRSRFQWCAMWVVVPALWLAIAVAEPRPGSEAAESLEGRNDLETLQRMMDQMQRQISDVKEREQRLQLERQELERDIERLRESLRGAEKQGTASPR